MYVKCGELRLAEIVFNQGHLNNLISRNTVISALVQNGQYRDALKLKEGKQIHGDLVSARNLFDRIFLKDVISWNTIIMTYAIHGYGEASIDMFSEMKKQCIKPNASTFVSVLSSCSISGMAEEGWKYFIEMKSKYGIDPCIEHYGCMLDLLGRVGELNKAKQLITEMPLEPTSRIWGSLLAASRRHKDLALAEFAANQILALELDNTRLYVLLANLYAETGRWEKVKHVKSIMESRGLTKTVAFTLVDVKGKTLRFTNEDKSHEDSNLIYKVLDVVLKNPNLSKFKPVDVLRKRSKSADWHSVRLAVCFGLISISIRKPVFVRKNVRICEDCHEVMKKISMTCHREIVVGDSKIHHHFKYGECSCRDYW
ncbi:pentatricopeptide repeat-containing protein [Tanacetum coccineum]